MRYCREYGQSTQQGDILQKLMMFLVRAGTA